jgi:hypothetical protein
LPPDTSIRTDLAVVELDGDLAVFDPITTICHVLSGGAVLVWAELDAGLAGLVQRVAERVGESTETIEADITEVIRQLNALGLLANGD